MTLVEGATTSELRTTLSRCAVKPTDGREVNALLEVDSKNEKLKQSYRVFRDKSLFGDIQHPFALLAKFVISTKSFYSNVLGKCCETKVHNV